MRISLVIFLIEIFRVDSCAQCSADYSIDWLAWDLSVLLDYRKIKLQAAVELARAKKIQKLSRSFEYHESRLGLPTWEVGIPFVVDLVLH